MYQLKNILQFKLLGSIRMIQELKFVSIILGLFMVLLIFILYKSNLIFNTRNTLFVLLFFLTTYQSLQRNKRKKYFLRQYGKVFWYSNTIDMFLLSIPILIALDYQFFCVVTLFILVYQLVDYYLFSKVNSTFNYKLWVIPSLFMKPSYMFHSHSRPLLPIVWGAIIMLQIIAFVYNNYNLSAVSFLLLTVLSIFITLMKYEPIGFIAQFSTAKHFILTSCRELFINTLIFIAAPMMLLLLFFPEKVLVSLLALLYIYITVYAILWVKYIFFQNEVLTLLFLLGFLPIQSVLLYFVYTIPLALILQYALYQWFYSSVKKMIAS